MRRVTERSVNATHLDRESRVREKSATNRAICGLWFACLALAPAAGAASLDLANPAPRWVAVAFEISPREHPSRLRASYTRRLPARLSPGANAGELEIRVAGNLVEQFLLIGHSPIPGSFGDFVWTFDARTGHVQSAALNGAVEREVGWGFASWTAEARIDVRMSTREAVSFRVAELAGETVHRICRQPSANCTRMEPTALDPDTGYVNAVGSIRADTGPLRVESFSPLGEAIFSEIETTGDALGFIPQALPVHADVGAATSADKPGQR